MSADNYWIIRRDGPQFAVSMGFESDDGPGPIKPHDPRFDTIEAARNFAADLWTEYGVREELEPPTTPPTFADLIDEIDDYRAVRDEVPSRPMRAFAAERREKSRARLNALAADVLRGMMAEASQERQPPLTVDERLGPFTNEKRPGV